MSTTTLATSDAATLAPFDASLLAGQLAPSSIAMYQRDFLAYVRFAGSSDAALDPATLGRWRASLANETDRSPHTINRMLSAVKRLVKEAAEQGYIDGETAAAFGRVAGVRPVALKTRTKPHARTRISPAEMRRLCAAPDTATLIGARDAALLATLASSGLRVAEAASLTVGQILSQSGGYLLVIRGKNDAGPREAPLSREARRLIMAWLTQRPVLSEYIFTSFAGRGGG